MADVEIVDVHSHFYPKTYVDKLMRRGFAETREGQVILKWGRRGSPASISAVNLEEKVKEVKKFSPELPLPTLRLCPLGRPKIIL